jgi:hypothetical protein
MERKAVFGEKCDFDELDFGPMELYKATARDLGLPTIAGSPVVATMALAMVVAKLADLIEHNG